MTERARRLVFAWAPAVLYMALIWTLSSMTFDTAPSRIPHFDKLIHFIEYGGLGFLLAHACFKTWPRKPWLRAAALAVLITVLWGWLDEIHQAFVPGRSSEALDLVADTVGAVCGAGARAVVRAVARRRSAAA